MRYLATGQEWQHSPRNAGGPRHFSARGAALVQESLQVSSCNRGGVASSSRSRQPAPKLREQPTRRLPSESKEPGLAEEYKLGREGVGVASRDSIDWLKERLQKTVGHESRAASNSAANGSSAVKHRHDPVEAVAKAIVRGSLRPEDVLSAAQLEGKELSRLLSYLTTEGNETQAAQALDWIEEQPRLRATRGLFYSQLMSAHGRSSGGPTKALQLFKRMRTEGVPLDLVSYNVVISAMVFEEMQAVGVKPDVFTYSSLIKACQACGNRWKDALGYLEQMKAEGVKPNVITYTTLMSCCQRAGQWERAMAVFREMEEAGVRADVMAYNSVISACARGARWENAWEVFGTMRRAGVRPNARSYNALISACERAGEPQRAVEAFRNMQKNAGATKLQPTLVTYNTLMSACAKGGMYSLVQQLYEDMQQRGIAPDVFTLSAMINACKRTNYWEEALEVVQEFSRVHGVQLNTIACNSLIETLGRAGRWQYALQVFDQLAAGDFQGTPDAWSYSGMVLACRSGEQHSLVLDFYQKMRARRMPTYKVVYHAVLEACETQGLWKEGREVLLQMQADIAASRLNSSGLDLAAWQAVFAIPPLMESVRKPIIAAARAAIDSGRFARRLVSVKKGKDAISESDEDEF